MYNWNFLFFQDLSKTTTELLYKPQHGLPQQPYQQQQHLCPRYQNTSPGDAFPKGRLNAPRMWGTAGLSSIGLWPKFFADALLSVWKWPQPLMNLSTCNVITQMDRRNLEAWNQPLILLFTVVSYPFEMLFFWVRHVLLVTVSLTLPIWLPIIFRGVYTLFCHFGHEIGKVGNTEKCQQPSLFQN